MTLNDPLQLPTLEMLFKLHSLKDAAFKSTLSSKLIQAAAAAPAVLPFAPFAAQQPAAPVPQSMQIMMMRSKPNNCASALTSCPLQLSPLPFKLPFKTFSTTRTSLPLERLLVNSILRLTPPNFQHSPTQQLDISTKQQLNKSQ